MIFVSEMKAAKIGQKLEEIDGTDKGTIELKDAFGVRVHWENKGAQFIDYYDVDGVGCWVNLKFVD